MIIQSDDTGTEMVRAPLTSQEYCWKINGGDIRQVKRLDLVILPYHRLSEVEIRLFRPSRQLCNIGNRSVLFDEQSHRVPSLPCLKSRFHSGG